MACTSVGTDPVDPAQPPSEQAPTPEATPASTPTPSEPPTPPKTAGVTVQMTAATLSDDCGGAPQREQAQGLVQAKSALIDEDEDGDDYACQQSSMQLSVVAAAKSPRLQLAVTKVELFDDKGTMLGPLTPRTPTVWTDGGTYQAWDESILGGQDLSVSYALSEPPWADVSDRGDRTYVLKATVTVDGEAQLLQHNIEIAAPSIYPADVQT